jgi:hypothetical protein
VTGGTFGPIDSNTICVINKHLGAASQASDPMLTNKFALYTSDHRGEGIAYLAMKWTLNEDSATVWEKYSPGNVKALVQGKQKFTIRALRLLLTTTMQQLLATAQTTLLILLTLQTPLCASPTT